MADDASAPGIAEEVVASEGAGTPSRSSTPSTAGIEPVPRRPRRSAVPAAGLSEKEEGRSSGKRNDQADVSRALEVGVVIDASGVLCCWRLRGRLCWVVWSERSVFMPGALVLVVLVVGMTTQW